MNLNALDFHSLLPVPKAGLKLPDGIETSLEPVPGDVGPALLESPDVPLKPSFAGILDAKAEARLDVKPELAKAGSIDAAATPSAEAVGRPASPLPPGSLMPQSGNSLPVSTTAAIAPAQSDLGNVQVTSEPLRDVKETPLKGGEPPLNQTALSQDGNRIAAPAAKTAALEQTPEARVDDVKFSQRVAVTDRTPASLTDVAAGKQVQPASSVAAVQAAIPAAIRQILSGRSQDVRQRLEGQAWIDRSTPAQPTASQNVSPAMLEDEVTAKADPKGAVDATKRQTTGSEQSLTDRTILKLDQSSQQVAPSPTSNGTPMPVLAPATAFQAPFQSLTSPPIATTAPAETRVAASIENAVSQLTEARESGRNIRPELALKHAEFGAVNMRLENVAGDLRATLSSRDPGFVPAVQAAMPERAVAFNTDQGSTASQRGNEGIGTGQSGSGNTAGHGGSLHGGANQNSDPRYGSSTGSGQASSQPYSAHQASEERNFAASEHDRTDSGLFA
ncbi:hypothetical protein [Erythrobacter crassostreae]|uniref:Uncharacterized protein n=1 Tax=Erythrobacter crassostreae TaxID=2828328 RepID=A0A9X1F260_9SPHN|nr:hypothetical protein [Erythrobacter crassostrea]MBV7258931.1 hypothetical protein [Erythrobacter crassostrea]